MRNYWSVHIHGIFFISHTQVSHYHHGTTFFALSNQLLRVSNQTSFQHMTGQIDLSCPDYTWNEHLASLVSSLNEYNSWSAVNTIELERCCQPVRSFMIFRVNCQRELWFQLLWFESQYVFRAVAIDIRCSCSEMILHVKAIDHSCWLTIMCLFEFGDAPNFPLKSLNFKIVSQISKWVVLTCFHGWRGWVHTRY